MSTRFRIASLVYMMTNAVLFGIGVIAIMTIPALSRHAFELIPAVVVASFVLAAPVAWVIAPRLQARRRRRAAAVPGH